MSAPPHLVHCGVGLSGQPCQQSAPQLLLRDDKRGNIPVLSKFFSITDKLFDLLNIGIESFQCFKVTFLSKRENLSADNCCQIISVSQQVVGKSLLLNEYLFHFIDL